MHKHHIHQDSSTMVSLFMLLIPICGMGIDIYTPALPSMSQYFITSHFWVKFSIAIYLFGFAFGQLIIGPLSDQYGRRNILLGSLLSFSVFSGATILVQHIHAFIALRLFQGLSVAGVVLCVRAMMADLYQGERLRAVCVYNASAWALSPVLAPILGAYLLSYFHWQACFLFLAFYSVVVFTLMLFLLPETHTKHKRTRQKFTTVWAHYKMVSGNWSYMKNVLALAVGFGMLNVYNVLGPFLVIEQYHHSYLYYGHTAMIIGVMYFIASFANRFIMRCLSTGAVILSCIFVLIMVSMSGLLLAYEAPLHIVNFIALVVVLSMVLGLMYPNYSALCTGMFQSMAGTAGAVRGAVSMAGAGLITALLGFVTSHNPMLVMGVYLLLALLLLLLWWVPVFASQEQKACLDRV